MESKSSIIASYLSPVFYIDGDIDITGFAAGSLVKKLHQRKITGKSADYDKVGAALTAHRLQIGQESAQRITSETRLL